MTPSFLKTWSKSPNVLAARGSMGQNRAKPQQEKFCSTWVLGPFGYTDTFILIFEDGSCRTRVGYMYCNNISSCASLFCYT